MKKRGISAAIALCIFIPILLYGHKPYAFAIFILSLQGMREILAARAKEKKNPIFITAISYLLLSYFILVGMEKKELVDVLDFRGLSLLFFGYLLPVIIYRKDSTYGIIDAFFMIGVTLFLSLSFTLLVVIRNVGLCWILYLFLITIFTDTYAYLTGKLIGKHKCIPSISPNKTWEGCIGGTLMGSYVASMYLLTITHLDVSFVYILLMTLFLSIIGQFGDLLFSAIKREFQIKDFSNFMPGHGGILDRLDSIFFVLFAFTFFMNSL